MEHEENEPKRGILDLCVLALAIERDFEINLDKVIDRFAEKHKNSRILSK